MEPVLAGLNDAFTLTNLVWVMAGVALGQFVGAVPGLGAPMAIAIAVPFTFTMNPLAAIAFLVAVNKGGTFANAVPAILINTPGSADAAATALDGHPLAAAGKPRKALKMALYSSVTGDTFSDVVLITASVSLAVLALRMGPTEIAALMILAIAVITGLVGRSMARGLAAAFLGLLLGSVGLDLGSGTPRLTFGLIEVYDGLPLATVAIGTLAVGEIFRQLTTPQRAGAGDVALTVSSERADRRVSIAEYLSCRMTMARGAIIGTIVGAIPGAGSSAAAFLSYASAQKASREPEKFGTGALEGVAAAESANSAVVGANMIPLLALGIPGNVTAALILGAFIIHGIQPGPLMFQEQGRLVYGLFGAMVLANGMNLVIGLLGLSVWAFVMRAPRTIIFPIAFLCCIVGTYIVAGGMSGVAIMLGFGVLGYLMRMYDFPVVALIIAFFIGPSFERSLLQVLVLADGDVFYLLDRPVALGLLALAALTIWHFGVRGRPRALQGGAG